MPNGIACKDTSLAENWFGQFEFTGIGLAQHLSVKTNSISTLKKRIVLSLQKR